MRILEVSRLPAVAALAGSEFHSRIVLGYKDPLLKDVELAGIWKNLSCMFLDKRLVGISLLVGSILTRLLLILYSNTSLACLLQASNDVHCS